MAATFTHDMTTVKISKGKYHLLGHLVEFHQDFEVGVVTANVEDFRTAVAQAQGVRAKSFSRSDGSVDVQAIVDAAVSKALSAKDEATTAPPATSKK